MAGPITHECFLEKRPVGLCRKMWTGYADPISSLLRQRHHACHSHCAYAASSQPRHVGDKRPQIRCQPPSKLLDFHVGTCFTSSVTSRAIVEVFRFLTKTWCMPDISKSHRLFSHCSRNTRFYNSVFSVTTFSNNKRVNAPLINIWKPFFLHKHLNVRIWLCKILF